jgi:hypothetical protein
LITDDGPASRPGDGRRGLSVSMPHLSSEQSSRQATDNGPSNSVSLRRRRYHRLRLTNLLDDTLNNRHRGHNRSRIYKIGRVSRGASKYDKNPDRNFCTFHNSLPFQNDTN